MRPPEERWVERFFPLPYVAAVALLVALIILTPNLISSGSPPAGSILTQAVLVVDRVAGDNVTHFYVRGLSTIRYASIAIGIASDYNWTSPGPPANLTWSNWTNATNVLSITVGTASDPVAVNVTAVYTATGAAAYVGLVAFYVVGSTLYIHSLDPFVSPPSSVPIGSLPVSLLLATVPVGTAP